MTARTLVTISGPDREDFLQGLVSNDVTKARDGLVYAALLTPQGKYLADFFIAAEDDTLVLDVAPDLAPGLVQRLSMYKLRADVTLATHETSVTRGHGTPPSGARPDPRAPEMGWRDLSGKAQGDDTDWDALRVKHCIPESGIELIPNETYLLEAGFERLSGVDFRKGCYVGQEVTARMKHKTELRKGFRTVNVDGAAPVGTEITANDRPAGTLYTQANGQGIAYLRFDRMTDTMQAGAATVSAA